MRFAVRMMGVALPALLLVASALRMQPVRAQTPARDHLVAIIAHATGVTDISLSALRAAFRGEYAEYAPGKRILPLNQAPGTAERVAFDKAVLSLDAEEMGRYWIARRIRGEGLAPRIYPTVSLGLRAVASYPGAITYVRAKQVNATVRVLTVDGHAAGKPGYPLPSL